ncbi:SpoIIE family protein phosphatase [Streptomyces parvus]|uniref:SpoIIE family protein phosphatase n=1 Tax=Streptomyces parvus TaxID=66428 RepID=UPI003D741335
MPSTVCRGQLQPGDRIVHYTDGITEARASDDTEFGRERFTDLLIRPHADGLPVPKHRAASSKPSSTATTDTSRPTPPC